MADKRIKGLTVEIGGDTSNLGKALESVESKANDLTDELRDINKQLKFDPKNTELIAQKQKVLAEIIEQTGQKLTKLKEAEKQVQEQFKRGDASEAQVRALQREIIATEGKLDSYQEQAKNAGKATKELGDEAEGAGAKFGRIAVGGLKLLGQGVVALSGALVASAEMTRDYRREMGKLDTAFTTSGHSSEAALSTYKALQGVLGETDQAVEAANHLAQLATNEEELAKWTDIATGVYATFGASLPIEGLTEAANETAKVGQVTGPLADALNWAGVSEDEFNDSLARCSNEQERQTLIMETLSGLYDEAATKYKETNAEVIRANEANEAWTASLAGVGAEVEPLLTDIKLLGASLLTELLPGVKDVGTALRGMLNGDEGAAASLGEALSGLLTQLTDKVVELLPAVTEMAVSLITTLATTIVESLPMLVETAVQIVLALIQGLTETVPALLIAIAEMIPQLVQALVEGIPLLIEGAVQLLMAIVDAVPLILPPLIEALPGIIDTIIKGLLDSIPLLVKGAVQLFFGILKAIPDIQAALIKSAPSIVKSLVEGLISSASELVDAGEDLLKGLIEGMLNFDIKGAVGKVGGAVVSAFKKAFDIHSPSRVMMEIGEMLDAGLAEGITDNADNPTQALDRLSQDMLGEVDSLSGVDVERRMTGAATTASTSDSGLLVKLDRILAAIESGKSIYLDSGVLVGATTAQYDVALGRRQALAERGAI